jgi:hypothetical protein
MMTPGLSRALSAALEMVARAGYAARGFVYLSIGFLALRAALQITASASGTRGAIAALSQWPFARIWLSAVALGLAAFAVWRALQSVIDADRQGKSPAALASRAGQAISGFVYGSLAWSTFRLLDRIREIHVPEEEASAHAGATQILAWPYGRWVLVGLGLFVVGSGLANIVRAVRGDVARRLVCGDRTRVWARRMGRIGYLGRGVAFLPLGFFVCVAGFRLDPNDAKNLGGAFQWVQDQRFGAWILFFIALGLIAFGLFALIEAWFRRIDVSAHN